MLRSLAIIGAAAGAQLAPRDVDAPLETQVADAAQAVMEAWRRRGLAGTVELNSNQVPATVPVGILCLEFLVHAWDFAIATGSQVIASEPVSEYVLAVAGKVITPATRNSAASPRRRRSVPLPQSSIASSPSPAASRPQATCPPPNERMIMPKRSEYRQGTPNWVDLQTTDQSAAKKFYTSLFGWGYDDNPVPGGGGVYSMATLNGEAVAAIAPMPPGAPEGMPPIWNTYIAVDDVDAVVDKVVPGGGQVMMPAFDIGDAGRMSFITDPTGAAVGLWQANRHIGATLVNETGTLIWNELLTDKPDLALAFYEAVVGLTHSSMEIAAGQNYRVLKAGDAEVGGCMEPPMPGVPNHWHVYFAVDDADATAAKAAAAGGQVIAEPADIPSVGRFAVLSDPQGAIFSVLKPAPQQ